MKDSMPPERPPSAPPHLPLHIPADDEGTPNPAFTHDEPIFVYDRELSSSFPHHGNHLIFGTDRVVSRPNDPNITFRSGRKTNGEATKYATARLKQGSQKSRRGELRGAHTVGRHSGHSYGAHRHAHIPHGGHSTFARGPGGDVTDAAPGGNIFRISTGERKENSFSSFGIEMDQVSSYQYRPGEEVKGAINIIVRKPVEIRFVELVVTGQGHMTLRKSRETLSPQTSHETYLAKQTFVIGSGDTQWSSVLTPGHYTSRFRVKLPTHLPSTAHHEDTKHGWSLDIAYTMRARICDSLPHTAHSQAGQQPPLVRVLLSRKMSFTVQRAFDLSLIPNAMAPVSHSEKVYLSCAHTDAAVVTLNLDRAVCLAGDDVRLTLTSELPYSHKVKEVNCVLQEHVALDPKHTPVTFTLARVIFKDPTHRVKMTHVDLKRYHLSSRHDPSQQVNECTCDVTLPTQTGFVSPHSLSSCRVKVTYSLLVELRISPAGGKLTFTVPIDIGPCAEPIYAEKISSRKAVPLFNRPTRFPCFSFPATPTPSSSSRPESAQSSRSALVTTKYTNNCFARCFLCCTTPKVDD